jgi:hypothetical protein
MTARAFDFAAAEDLSQRLSQLAEKLDWLVWLRDSQRGSLLGEPSSDRWKGRRRNQFEHQFSREQSRLKALAAQARELKSAVDKQIAGAHAARAAEHKESVRNQPTPGHPGTGGR